VNKIDDFVTYLFTEYFAILVKSARTVAVVRGAGVMN